MLPENTLKYFKILVRNFSKNGNANGAGGDLQMLFNILKEFNSNVLVDGVEDEGDRKDLETYLEWLTVQLILMSISEDDQR
jgi:hypothetical protein